MKPSLVVVALVTFAQALTAQTPDNPLLTRAFDEDVASRRSGKIEDSDGPRIRVVLEQLAASGVRTPADKAHAALVLQHSPLTFRGDDLVAVSPDNYLLAHLLAKQAYEAGFEGARFLVAQTIDRYLAFTVGVQRYGTQRVINQKTGAEELVAIDRS